MTTSTSTLPVTPAPGIAAGNLAGWLAACGLAAAHHHTGLDPVHVSWDPATLTARLHADRAAVHAAIDHLARSWKASGPLDTNRQPDPAVALIPQGLKSAVKDPVTGKDTKAKEVSPAWTVLKNRPGSPARMWTPDWADLADHDGERSAFAIKMHPGKERLADKFTDAAQTVANDPARWADDLIDGPWTYTTCKSLGLDASGTIAAWDRGSETADAVTMQPAAALLALAAMPLLPRGTPAADGNDRLVLPVWEQPLGWPGISMLVNLTAGTLIHDGPGDWSQTRHLGVIARAEFGRHPKLGWAGTTLIPVIPPVPKGRRTRAGHGGTDTGAPPRPASTVL